MVIIMSAKVMTLVCNLELCVPLSKLERGSNSSSQHFLFPCLLPAAAPRDFARHWPVASDEAPSTPPAAPLVVRGHRFRAREAFLPPGLFPTLVARLARLPQRCVHSSRLWKDVAVLHFRKARALLRVDLAAATLDVVVAAPADAWHFVGAGKGQASAVRWLAHLIRQMLARAYAQIGFDEAWLCPNPTCHGLPAHGTVVADPASVGSGFGAYRGSEFTLEPVRAKASHACERDGCWNFLGTGHKLEPLCPLAGGEGAAAKQACTTCGQEAYFPLRAGGGFGWASKEDAELMRAGMSMAQPRLGFGMCA